MPATAFMQVLIPLLALVLVAYHLWTRHIPSLRRVLAYVVAACAVVAFWTGLRVAIAEDALGRFGQVVVATVSEKTSTTGEQRTGVIPRIFSATAGAFEGTEFYDLIQRLIATRSIDAWAVTCTYPCQGARPCVARALVSHQRWLQMRTGDRVNVRYVTGPRGSARLEDESLWATAIARIAMGVALAAAAVLIAGTRHEFTEAAVERLRRPA